MRFHGKTWPTVICALLACIIVLFGCSLPGATGSASSTPGEGVGAGSTATGGSSGSARATATPTPPPHALAWFQQDSHQVGQIWASVNGGAAHQVTHMPASTAECRYDAYWS